MILDAIRRIVRVLRTASRAAERDVGLSGAQLFVLQKLAETDSLSLGDLARRTFTHQSSVSVVVARLTERRLVRRHRARDDSRRLEITLTAAGHALLRRAPAAAQEHLVSAIEDLEAGDRALLARLLSRLTAGIGVGKGAPPMLFEDQ